MDKSLEIVNEFDEMDELFEVGGDIGCYVACVGGCLITDMVMAPMVVATLALS